MKRIAYIGLSTPIFYDYSFNATETMNNLNSSPNPILDSPYGLFLLYDEIWFLCESLCPDNLRHVDFVKFMDKEKLLPDIRNISSDIKNKIAELTESDNEFDRRPIFNNYQEIVEEKGINWEARPDNHTHSLKICNETLSGNSLSLENVLFDIELVNRINLKNIELITNTFTSKWYFDNSVTLKNQTFAEVMTINDIPNYIHKSGPYHPSIEEARNSKNLKSFRQWILDQNTSVDIKEMKDVKETVQKEIQKIQDELFLKYMDPKNCLLSAGKTGIGVGIDALTQLPVSTGISLVANAIDVFGKQNKRWQAFIIESKYILNEIGT